MDEEYLHKLTILFYMKRKIVFKSIIFYALYLAIIFILYAFIEGLYKEEQKVFIIILSCHIFLAPVILWYKEIRLKIIDSLILFALLVLTLITFYAIDRNIDYKYQKVTEKSEVKVKRWSTR